MIPIRDTPRIAQRPPGVRSVVFIPLVKSLPEVQISEIDAIRLEMADIFINSWWQLRKDPLAVMDVRLMKAAQNKAEEMARLDFVAHTSPSGVTANENIRNAGYVLPDWYEEKGNNCESVAGGQKTAADCFEALLNSPNHAMHITGTEEFYRDQRCFGVGHMFNENSTNKDYWVVITAPCME